MVLVNYTAAPKLALNEACEQKHVMSDMVMQPISAFVVAVAVVFLCVTLVRIVNLERSRSASWYTSFAAHACFAQLFYHVVHLFIHCVVDMSHEEMQQRFNPLLCFNFAHQAGTLGALFFQSWTTGFMLPFLAVSGMYTATGMIYPTIWTYLPLVAVFRCKLGWPAVAGSIATLGLTGMEVKFCDVLNIRDSIDYRTAFPFHALADSSQSVSVIIQCLGLLAFVQGAASKGKKL